MKSRWIDVSVTLRDGMAHWPDNPPVEIRRTLDMDRGDVANVTRLAMGSHTGTHMDAPIHFVKEGKGLDEMPLDATVGKARVVAIKDKESIKPAELKKARIRAGERVLFKTVNSGRVWAGNAFVEDYVYLSTDGARFLVDQGVQTIGVDYLSLGGYRAGNGLDVHRVILGAGVWVIEGLDLSRVKAGSYQLVCLPLKIARGDGAPCRAILRPA